MKKTLQKPEVQMPVPVYTYTLRIEDMVIDKWRFGSVFGSSGNGVTLAQTRGMENDRVRIIEANEVKRLRDNGSFVKIFNPGEWCYIRNSEGDAIEILIMDKASKIRDDTETISEKGRFRIGLRYAANDELQYLESKNPDALVALILPIMDAWHDYQGRVILEGAPVVLLKHTGPSLRQ